MLKFEDIDFEELMSACCVAHSGKKRYALIWAYVYDVTATFSFTGIGQIVIEIKKFLNDLGYDEEIDSRTIIYEMIHKQYMSWRNRVV